MRPLCPLITGFRTSMSGSWPIHSAQEASAGLRHPLRRFGICKRQPDAVVAPALTPRAAAEVAERLARGVVARRTAITSATSAEAVDVADVEGMRIVVLGEEARRAAIDPRRRDRSCVNLILDAAADAPIGYARSGSPAEALGGSVTRDEGRS